MQYNLHHYKLLTLKHYHHCSTGLYLWWKLSATRAWGWLAIGGGIATLLSLLATL